MLIKIKDREAFIPDDINDISIEKYLNLNLLFIKIEEMTEISFLIEYLKILSGWDESFIKTLYETETTQFNDLFNPILELIKNSPTPKEAKTWTFNGVLYSCARIGILSIGERSDIDTLNSTNKNQLDIFLNYLSIMIRPATEAADEFGNVTYTVKEYEADTHILNERKKIFKDMPASNVMFIINSFTNGIQK